VIFSYQDNGCGISADNLELIFEPFYTTKRGQGSTGLGLHILYNCVSQSLKGTVECTSEVGKGTTFTIAFPCKSNWNTAL
jgi:signal transduction histidine kinase